MAERDEKGRFIKGTVPNPNGRPPAVKEVKYYEILKANVTEQDWAAIVSRAKQQARAGDDKARKWLTDNLIGLPTQKSEIELKDNKYVIGLVNNAD